MQVAGVLLLDVDDFCQDGNSSHEELMSQLRTRLKFGKWHNVYNDTAEYIGRTLKQLESFEIQVSTQRYIQEKLKAVVLPKERLKDKTALLNEKEISWLKGSRRFFALGWQGGLARRGGLFNGHVMELQRPDHRAHPCCK